MKKLRSINVPSTASIKWCNLYENSEDHICDEDITFIELNSGILIDAGQYGDPSFFRVEAIAADSYEQTGSHWDAIEQVECETTEQVAKEIERMSLKYSK